MPSGLLRELAVTVREYDLRSYFWVLMERSLTGEWEEVSISSTYQPSWIEAFEAGIAHLYEQAPNRLLGPRA